LPQGLRKKYFESFQDLGKILTKINPNDKKSLQNNKKNVEKYFSIEFQKGSLTSLRLVLDYILKPEIDDEVIRIKHISKFTCSSQDCTGLRVFLKSKFLKARYSPYIEHELRKEVMTLQEVVNDYFDYSQTCRFCKKTLKCTRSDITNPLVLLIDITKVTINDIHSEIFFNSVSYTINAVSYYNNDTKHFTALLKIDNKMYSYDGMTDEGKLSEVAQENFEVTYSSTLIAQMLWYIKK
jgi:hypothetical protein